MKKLAFIFLLAFTGITAMAQEKTGVTITVTIENVLKEGGTILGSLHTENTFMKGPGIQNAAALAAKGEVTITFNNVQPGTFAIMVMHDENDNKTMDMADNGMPLESYGTSGAMEAFGPPSFTNAKFEVTDTDQDLRIRF